MIAASKKSSVFLRQQGCDTSSPTHYLAHLANMGLLNVFGRPLKMSLSADSGNDGEI